MGRPTQAPTPTALRSALPPSTPPTRLNSGPPFPSPCLAHRHVAIALLSCASQFFLCTSKTAWLDGKHTVFGAVTKGYETVLAIEKVGSQSGTTSKPVVIKDSGIVKP